MKRFNTPGDRVLPFEELHCFRSPIAVRRTVSLPLAYGPGHPCLWSGSCFKAWTPDIKRGTMIQSNLIPL